MTGSPPMPPNFIGVRRPNFDELERQHRRAAERLDRCAYVLWLELKEAGLDTSPATRIRELANRVRVQARDLGRRLQLVRQMEHRPGIDLGFGAPEVTWVAMPDRIYDMQARVDGNRAAELAIKIATKGSPSDFVAFKSITHRHNPEFAKAFMERLRAEGMIDLVGRLGLRLHSASSAGAAEANRAATESKFVLQIVSQSLAQTTNPQNREAYLGPEFLQEVRVAAKNQYELPTGQQYSGYWAIGQILHSADPLMQFSGAFTGTVGRDMVAWDKGLKKDNSWPESVGPFALRGSAGSSPAGEQHPRVVGIDPIAGLVKVAATNKDAAQGLFNDGDGNPPETLKHLLTGRWEQWNLGDRGDSLGQALEQAAKGHDPLSRRLAAQFVQIRAEDIRTFMKYGEGWQTTNPDKIDALSGMRDSTSVILGNHLSDVSAALNHPQDSRPVTNQPISADQYIPFDARDLGIVFADIGRDKQAYKILLGAQAAHMRQVVHNAYFTPGKLVSDAASREAKTLGYIVAGFRDGQVGAGKEMDKARQESEEAMQSVAELVIGALPVPGAKKVSSIAGDTFGSFYEDAAREVFGELSRTMLEGDAKSEASKAVIGAAQEGQATSMLISRIIGTAVAEQGLDMSKLKEAAADRGEGYLLFVKGKGDDVEVVQPHEWSAEQWRSFYSYSETYDDPRVPAGREATQSLSDANERALASFENGRRAAQENLEASSSVDDGANS